MCKLSTNDELSKLYEPVLIVVVVGVVVVDVVFCVVVVVVFGAETTNSWHIHEDDRRRAVR